jgi:lauroyl/myristoyl acyltransferase
MGAFEPALAMLRGIEPRVHVLYQPDVMPRFERARAALRRRLGVIEHPLSDGVGAWSAMLDALRADEAVLVLADRVMSGQSGAAMPFLGLERAMLPTGVLRLAASHGSPIVPTYSVRERGGIRVWSDPFIPTAIERLTAAEVVGHPAQLALLASMERAIRAHPTQWMAFHDLRPADRPEARR